ncbi:cytochrome b/b6 domain-containing protein [Hyphococcus luteus]|uniref:Cytochrome B n=1 Tax=Hyphococcus luteus TaxID=2058213 RepID=A0A2S7K2V7_9PROT|nr:cytochrome b/b6 domain-containing protein [Marinicaulis flavus]PQA86842.1 cytochrome B [Marinicaulis flavus]
MTAARYTPVAAILHWTIAALIIGQIFGGMYMHGLPNSSPVKFDLYQLHKSFGLTVLALSLVRLGWRFTHKAPPLPASTPGWQKIAARVTHWAFYALMILTPLAGWAIVSVSPTDIPTKWFGVIPVPHLPFFGGVEDREAAEHLFEERHELLAKIILVLLVLHVGAALKHAFMDKDGVFESMLPERKGPWLGFAAIFAALGAGVIVYFASPKPGVVSLPAHTHEDGGHEDAAGGNWAVDYGASSLAFIGSEKGRPFEGAFNDFTAVIAFYPEDLEASSIDVTVRTASASTGDSLRDSNLPNAQWFDVKDHPEARFVSTDIRAVGDGYEADGVLKIKDYEKPVTLAFDLDIDGDAAAAAGGVDLVRTDFGLGENDDWLEEEGVALNVRVEFEIKATRKD